MASFSVEEGEKKPRDFLDLKHVLLSSAAEVRRWMEKIPDLKIRLEKVLEREVTRGADGPAEEDQSEPFTDPVPPAMREVNLKELGRVDINWRMLTMARPKTKVEEDLFSRLVQLEKLEYRTQQWEEEGARRDGPSRGGASHLKLLESGPRGGAAGRRGGGGGAVVADTRLAVCRECGEELCSGSTCRKYTYEECARSLNPLDPSAIFHSPKLTSGARPKKPPLPAPAPLIPDPAPAPPEHKVKKTKRKSKKVKKSKKKDSVKDEPAQ